MGKAHILLSEHNPALLVHAQAVITIHVIAVPGLGLVGGVRARIIADMGTLGEHSGEEHAQEATGHGRAQVAQRLLQRQRQRPLFH